jgi:hypothetical protein
VISFAAFGFASAINEGITKDVSWKICYGTFSKHVYCILFVRLVLRPKIDVKAAESG